MGLKDRSAAPRVSNLLEADPPEARIIESCIFCEFLAPISLPGELLPHDRVVAPNLQKPGLPKLSTDLILPRRTSKKKQPVHNILKLLVLALALTLSQCAHGTLRMALVSSKSEVDDLAVNLTNHLIWIDKAVTQGAEFVGFPECSLTGYRFGPGYGISLASPEVQVLVDKAVEKAIYISFGVAEASSNTWYNTQVLAGPTGLMGIMHKVSLIDNSAGESTYCTAGTDYPHFNVKGMPLGIAICADATYFEPIQELAANGAQAIFVPHATYLQSTPQSWINWRLLGEYNWPVYATNLNVYLIGCNNAGLYDPPQDGENDRHFASGALVVGPDGSALAQSSITNNIETMVFFDLPVPETLTITSQPTNQTVLKGTDATFSVGAAGAGPLSYQWYFDTSAIDGATNQTLVLTNVQTSAAGNYTVSVANPSASITSNPALLTIHDGPHLSVVFSGGGLQLEATGLLTGATYVLEVSDDFENWQMLSTVPSNTNPWRFADPDFSAKPMRFYRLGGN